MGSIADLFATLRIKPNKGSFDAADKLIGGLKTALIGLVGFEALKGLGEWVQSTVEAGSHIHDLAQATGVATDELQVLGYIAKQNGSDMDSVARAMGKLQNNMKAATEGNKEAGEAFNTLGVKVTDANGKLRPAKDVYGDIAVAQHKLTNATEKGNLMFRVMGKTGREQIPVMEDIAEKGFGKLTQEAYDLGAVMDGKALDALDEFGDTQDRVKAGLTGLKNQAVITLLPQIQKMANAFLAWVKVNRVLLAQKLAFVFSGLVKVLTALAWAVGKVVDVFMFLADHWEWVAVVLGGLVLAVGIFEAASIGAALASAAAWVIAALPIVLLGLLLAGVILIVQDLYEWFTGGDSALKELYNSAKKWIGDKFSEVFDAVVDGMRARFESFFAWCGEKLEWLWNKINSFLNFFDATSGIITPEQREKLLAQQQTSDTEVGAAQGGSANAAARVANRFFGRNGDGSAQVPDEILGQSTATPPSTPPSTNVTIAPPVVNVTVNGANGTPEQNASAVKKVIDDWFGDQLNIAGDALGVR